MSVIVRNVRLLTKAEEYSEDSMPRILDNEVIVFPFAWGYPINRNHIQRLQSLASPESRAIVLLYIYLASRKSGA
jgi:hypothetical protein